MIITKFLGIQNLPEKSATLIRTYLLLSLCGAFLGNLSSTFFILFAYDQIGITQASIVMSVILLVQLITDYPSGSLGDWIGQRWVLIIAMSCYGIFYYLLTTVITFTSFLVLAFFNGLANAQASGALESWLDNNFQKAVGPADPERKIYGFSMARITSLNRIIMATAFITGGTMVTLISREHVFFVQACLSFVIIILVFFLVKDVRTDTKEEFQQLESSDVKFFTLLTGGFKFLVSSKTAFFFLVGISLIYASFSVWGTLILFPIYFGYSGSDGLASVFRTIMFLIGIPIGITMANVSKKFSNDKLPHFYFLFTFSYFPPFIVLLAIIPITNSYNLLGLSITAIVLTLANNCLFDIAETLRGRTLLDLVPSENRNAVYSLIPTIVSIFAIPLLPVAGKLIEDFDLRAGIVVPLALSIIGTVFISFSLYFKKKTQ